MNSYFRDIRLIPIVLLATICLFALKVSGIVFDGGYTMGERMQKNSKPGMTVTTADSVPAYPKIVMGDAGPSPDAPALKKSWAQEKKSWAQEMFNFNGAASDNDNDATASRIDGRRQDDVTGSVTPAERAKQKANDVTGSAHGGGEAKPPANAEPPLKTSDKPPEPTKLDVGGQPEPLPAGKINSPGERAILGRLQDRRQELDDRQRSLDMRESLIKAAEKRLEAKVNELKEVEARIKAATSARDQAEATRFKSIVAMYENMKPKDAARIFDRLDMRILAEVATALKPRTMSEILANMQSASAEKLTVELANRANARAKPAEAGVLPKIEGKPTNG
jgi:flagellar motility protein MotE (MotC chaperone)